MPLKAMIFRRRGRRGPASAPGCGMLHMAKPGGEARFPSRHQHAAASIAFLLTGAYFLPGF
jgi:hypothetical protein